MAMLRLLWLPGIVLFFAIAAPWFVLMQQRFDSFSHYFFVVQHFQRYSQATFNNPQPFWFYPLVLIVLALPWTAWLVGARKLAWRGDGEAVSVRRLILVWIASITLFFSMPHSKLVGYIFPVVAPMLFLAADAGVASGRKRAWKICGIAVAVLCVAATVALAVLADRSQVEVGRILRERMQPGDTVIALEEYRFALPFEARLRNPIVVVSDWSPRVVNAHDNWRKELADAAVFDPKQDWLVTDEQLPARVCAASTTWLVGGNDVARKYGWLAQAERVASNRKLNLWRVDAASPVRAALCRGTPSVNSAGK
jgi:4-amino-4-deoxy-L-arabinose transferase-like glycosyltransferase